MDSRVVNMLRFNEYVLFTFGFQSGQHGGVIPMFFFCIGLESGQHVEILIRSIILDLRVVNMLRVSEHILRFGVREWSTCWHSTSVFVALDSRVVNMLRVYEYVLLFFRWEWSTCWDSIKLFMYLGLESGQHVDIRPMFSIAFDSRLVNMLWFEWIRSIILDLIVVNILIFNENVLLCLAREWSTCWKSANVFRLPLIREWSTCWDVNETSYYVGFESGPHVEIMPMFSIALDARSVNMLIFSEYVLFTWDSSVVDMLIVKNVCFHVWLTSGGHFETLAMYYIALVSRVVNMLRSNEFILRLWTWEWSTCWDSMNMFFCLVFESGEHVEIPPIFSIALGSSVANMLRL